MKSYITLFVLAVVMVLIAPAFAGEEPYKAAVYEDSEIPPFYISPKLAQFTHPETFYYGHCYYYIRPEDGIPIDPKVCYLPEGSEYFLCPSKCQESFRSKTTPIFPEVCCGKNTSECPDIGNSRITMGNGGWYEWVIGLPKKPEGELNIEIECGVLVPDAWEVLGNYAINLCTAETGEILDPSICKRMPGSTLNIGALPKITATAYPGAQNDFKPFHLTAYKNPSDYKITRTGRKLSNGLSLQLLAGGFGARITLKPCMDKTIMVKWPVDGEINALGEIEKQLEAGDLIKVRMDVPKANTVDIYCSQYSVKIGGIGEPPWIPAGEIDCRYHCNLQWPQLPLEAPQVPWYMK